MISPFSMHFHQIQQRQAYPYLSGARFYATIGCSDFFEAAAGSVLRPDHLAR